MDSPRVPRALGQSPKAGVVLPRRKRSGIMNWLFKSFSRASSVSGSSQPPESGCETEAPVGSLRGAASSIFSINRISRGRFGKGPPVFERKRRRHKTVVWKYKKTIGLFASFVFIANQILASGQSPPQGGPLPPRGPLQGAPRGTLKKGGVAGA